MSRATADDQLRFLLSCVKHSNSGKIDFNDVARECGIVSKGAAAKRYERLMKSNGIHPGNVSQPSISRSGLKQRTQAAIAKSVAAKRRKIEGDFDFFRSDDEDRDFKPFIKPEEMKCPIIKSEMKPRSQEHKSQPFNAPSFLEPTLLAEQPIPSSILPVSPMQHQQLRPLSSQLLPQWSGFSCVQSQLLDNDASCVEPSQSQIPTQSRVDLGICSTEEPQAPQTISFTDDLWSSKFFNHPDFEHRGLADVAEPIMDGAREGGQVYGANLGESQTPSASVPMAEKKQALRSQALPDHNLPTSRNSCEDFKMNEALHQSNFRQPVVVLSDDVVEDIVQEPICGSSPSSGMNVTHSIIITD